MSFIYNVITTDPFNRPNENPVNPAVWTDDLGDGIPACQIISDQLVATDTGESIAISVAQFTNDMWAQFQLNVLNGSVGDGGEAAALLVLRRQLMSADNGFAVEIDGPLGPNCQIAIFSEKDDALTYYLGSNEADAVVSFFAGDSIRCELYQGTITAYVIHGGVSTQILAPTACDNTLVGTYAAMDLFDNTDVSDVQITNFQGGSITFFTPPPPPPVIHTVQATAHTVWDPTKTWYGTAMNFDFSAPTTTPAHTVLLDGTISAFLQVWNFNFNIPLNATVLGVQVAFSARNNGFGTVGTNDVQLFSFPGGMGIKKEIGSFYTLLWNEEYTGNPADLWQCQLTPAIVNDFKFGFQVNMRCAAASTVHTRFYKMTITYSTPG